MNSGSVVLILAKIDLGTAHEQHLYRCWRRGRSPTIGQVIDLLCQQAEALPVGAEADRISLIALCSNLRSGLLSRRDDIAMPLKELASKIEIHCASYVNSAVPSRRQRNGKLFSKLWVTNLTETLTLALYLLYPWPIATGGRGYES